MKTPLPCLLALFLTQGLCAQLPANGTPHQTGQNVAITNNFGVNAHFFAVYKHPLYPPSLPCIPFVEGAVLFYIGAAANNGTVSHTVVNDPAAVGWNIEWHVVDDNAV